MLQKITSYTSIRATIFLSSLFVLSGCLSGGGSASDPVDPIATDAGSSGEILKSHSVSGSVGDGPVIGADIRVESRTGKSLGTANSGSGSDFSLVVKTQASDYPLLIVATGGTDLVTMAAPDFTLRGAVKGPESESVANLNPFTTLAVEMAKQLPGGITDANIDSALEVVVSQFGSGLSSLSGVETLESSFDASNITEIVKASEAAGEVVRRTRDAMRAVGRNVSGDSVIAALAADLADDVIDGRGAAQADARTAAIASVTMAQVMMESMANRLHVQGTDATDRMNSAIDQIFAGTPSPALAELPVTTEMIDAARRGIVAGAAFQPSPGLDQVLAQLEELQPGMSTSDVADVLVTDASTTVDTLALAVAAASSADAQAINDLVRTGGLPGIPDVNRRPQVSGIPATTITVGSTYDFAPDRSDADGDTLTFSISGKPSWAKFDNTSGRLSGTPGTDDVGSNPGIVITVFDGELSASLPGFTLTVLSGVTNGAPEIGGSPSAQVTAGGFYGFTPVASDPDGDALIFSVANAPSWASFDTATGSLGGTPQAGDVGTWSGITLTVSDGAASASLQAFSITVGAAPPSNSAPRISGNAPDSVTVGEEYYFLPSASDDDGDTMTFSVTGLPSSWLSFNENSGRLRGTPGSGAIGTHGNIVVTVSDGQVTRALPPIEITVRAEPNRAPSISGNPSANATAGSKYSFTPLASDADGDTLSFSVSGLPSWASFNTDSGRLQGTPDNSDVGNYTSIVITVTDGHTSDTLNSFSITVASMPTLGSTTLNWQPPTQNEDGTSLTDLAGYRIYWGTSSGNYTHNATINNAGLTTYVVDNLSPGTWHFVTTALNSDGVESDYSNVATRTIQ